MTEALKFKQDGKFKIVHLTDLHWRDGDRKDRLTLAFMEEVLVQEAPDLIVITGDVIHKRETPDPLQAFEMALAPVIASGIPWALVFGNHDWEADLEMERLVELLRRLPNSLFVAGPPAIEGISNYTLGIQGHISEQDEAVLYMLDSGAKTKQPFGGSAWIHRNQIAWYIEQSTKRTSSNNGVPIPSLAFFHIPLPEYNEVWDFKTCYGTKNGTVACPKMNSGLFAALVEMGDVMGTFAGHNHHNDYFGDLHGIRLCYSRVSGYGLGHEGFARGARIILLEEGKRSFDTYQRLDNGQVLLHPPEHRASYIDPYNKRNDLTLPMPKRIVDVDQGEGLPKRFRMSTDPLRDESVPLPDLSGFRELQASASGQFSLNGLRAIKLKISSIPIVIVDLRQECHGFLDGKAISWYSPYNAMNKGLSPEEVSLRESHLLIELNQTSFAEFEELEGKSAYVGQVTHDRAVMSEEELVRREGMDYARFMVTDHHRPLDPIVERFVQFVDGLPAGRWLHFHCRGGVGRASTFMLLYDMLRHAGRISLEDYLNRHIRIGGRDMNVSNPADRYKYEAAMERRDFIRAFYAYAAATHSEPARMSWSEWCKQKE